MSTMEEKMFLKREPLLPPELEQIVTHTIECGLTVHRVLGPGFREPIYAMAFRLELELRKMKFESEKKVDVRYKDWVIPGQRVDLIVEGVVLVELKAVKRLKELHASQVVSYLRTTGLRVGLLMKDGLRRIVV